MNPPPATTPTPALSSPVDTTTWEVAVIGGGAAGLSAATTLGRFRQRVVVIDDATPRNAPADHVHNLLTRDGTPPAEIYRIGRVEVERYGGQFLAGTVTAVRGSSGSFTLDVGERVVTARRVVVASGGWDALPDVPGLAQRWGKDVIHCGFCHGYEVRDQRIGILATGPAAIHQSLMFRLLSPHVTVLTHVAPPTEEQEQDLISRGITITTGEVTEVLAEDDRLTGVRLADGSDVALDALVIATTVHARADFLAPLGLTPVDFSVNGHVMATRIETGPNGATSVPGVWVVGNAAEPMAQVLGAASGGLAAASAIVGEAVFAGPTDTDD